MLVLFDFVLTISVDVDGCVVVYSGVKDWADMCGDVEMRNC